MEYEHSSAIAMSAQAAMIDMVQSFQHTQADLAAPHVKMRAKVYRDGDQWCCLYGENLIEGVCGFGATPQHACEDFDKTWELGDQA